MVCGIVAVQHHLHAQIMCLIMRYTMDTSHPRYSTITSVHGRLPQLLLLCISLLFPCIAFTMGLIHPFFSTPDVVIFLPLVYCGDGSATLEAICIFPTSAVNAFWQEVSLTNYLEAARYCEKILCLCVEPDDNLPPTPKLGIEAEVARFVSYDLGDNVS